MSVFDPKEITLRDGATLTLRSPAPDEAPVLLDYLDAVRRESQGILFSPDDDLPTVEWERDWIDKRNQHEHTLMLGVWDADILVGLASVSGGEGFLRSQHRGELGISLRRDWWGQGLGKQVMETLIDFAEQDDTIQIIRLCVYSFNERAIALYENCGFLREGVRRCSVKFEDGSFADEMQMSRWVGTGDAPVARVRDPLLP